MSEPLSHQEALKHSGLKNTKQRHAILSVLEKSPQPLNAEQIYLALVNEKIAINLSTVYRVLNTLVAKELIIKTSSVKDNKALFELNAFEHRHHLVCVECKKIILVDECPFEEYEKKLKEKMGFTILGHQLEIYGVCEKCQKRIEEENKRHI
jgi:Fur family ferric uptake transcriptional regulator